MTGGTIIGGLRVKCASESLHTEHLVAALAELDDGVLHPLVAAANVTVADFDELMLARRGSSGQKPVTPSLSVGLFGDWGSGKNFS